MKREIVAIDLGGSGAKYARFRAISGLSGRLRLIDGPEQLGQPDWDRIEEWLACRIARGDAAIAVSTAGLLAPQTGFVYRWAPAGWTNRQLGEQLKVAFGTPEVSVIGDGDAHLLAHLATCTPPVIGLAIGSAVAFGVADLHRQLLLSPAGRTWDIGEWPLPTRASQRQVWFALGGQGLAELERDLGETEGRIHFGRRLATLVASLGSTFQPTTVVLSGGIIHARWPEIAQGFRDELQHAWPDWLPAPRIVSTNEAHAALIGAASAYLSYPYDAGLPGVQRPDGTTTRNRFR